MGLLLVIDQLVFPSLVIKRDQFFSRVKILIQETGDQNMFFAVTDPLRVVQRVADHSDEDPIAILLAVVGIAINLETVASLLGDFAVR